MVFIARTTLKENNPPLRLYFHEAELGTVYGDGTGTKSSLIDAAAYALQVIKSKQELSSYDLLIATIWGKLSIGKEPIKERRADIFSFSDIKNNWHGNPDISCFSFVNGLYVSRNEITCGDSLIMLGKEEEHRRKSYDMDKYLTSYPDLGDLCLA